VGSRNLEAIDPPATLCVLVIITQHNKLYNNLKSVGRIVVGQN